MPAKYNTTSLLLSQYAIQRRNAPNMYIGKKVAPLVTVDLDDQKYLIFGAQYYTPSSSAGLRPASTRAERVDFTYSLDNYNCKEHAKEAFLDDWELQNAQSELNVERQKVNVATDTEMIDYEFYVANKAFNVTTFAGYTAALMGAQKWSNAASDPRIQAEIARVSILNGALVDPSKIKLFIGYQVWANLKLNPTILGTFKFTNPYALTTDMLAKALDISEVCVGYAQYADEQTGVVAGVWDADYALFAYVNDSAGIEDVSCMKTFVVKDKDLRIETYRDEPIKSNVYRAIWNYDTKVPCPSSGYLFSAVL